MHLAKILFSIVTFSAADIDTLLQWNEIKVKCSKIMSSPAGNRTPVSRVTGGDTNHYTTEDLVIQLQVNILKHNYALNHLHLEILDIKYCHVTYTVRRLSN